MNGVLEIYFYPNLFCTHERNAECTITYTLYIDTNPHNAMYSLIILMCGGNGVKPKYNIKLHQHIMSPLNTIFLM